MGGAFFGIVTGVARSEDILYRRDRWADVELQGAEVLVVAEGHGHDEHVQEVLAHHGGRLIAA
jgi:hypothetical protein